MAAQPPPHAPEQAFPQVQQGYQEVPVQQNKPAVAQPAQPPQYPSEYTPAPPQYYPSPQAGVPQQPGYPYGSQSMQNTNVSTCSL